MLKRMTFQVILILAVTNLYSGNFQIPFIKNNGQVEQNVSYYVNTFYGATYVLNDGKILHSVMLNSNENSGYHLFAEKFINGNANQIIGVNPSKTKINYFKGNNTIANINSYNSICINNIYSGIDLELLAYANNTEKLFKVSPNIDPSKIQIEIEGILKMYISESGELIMESEKGKTSFTKPIAYQMINGKRQNIDAKYCISGNCYSFKLGGYNANHELFIDPLISSTFVGGSSKDEDYQPNVAIDSEGNVFVTGNTFSSEATFPMLSSAYDANYAGQSDRFICKFSNDLSTLLAATYIGGSAAERGPGICIDNEDNIYIGGYTQSVNDFPTVSGCYDVIHNGLDDAYVAKFNNDLDELLACTFYGGSNLEGLDFPRIDIKINSLGNVYIVGNTLSDDLPIVAGGTYDSTFNGGSDSFVAYFDAGLTTLLGSTYLGGDGYEWWLSVDFDSDDNVFVCGGTPSMNFPVTEGAFMTTHDNYSDVYITKFTSDLDSIISSTFIGSPGDEWASSMHIKDNEVFVSGYAGGYFASLMNSNSYQSNFGGGYIDGFVARLNNNLSELIACTFIGGSDDETSSYMIHGLNDDVYVCGKTASLNLLPYPFNTIANDPSYNGGVDAYLFRLDDDLTTLKAATYLGGNNEDRLQGLALNSDGSVFVVGRTESANFPALANSFDDSYNGGINDVFVSKFDSLLLSDPPYADFTASIVVGDINQQITFTDNSILEYESYSWEFGEGAFPPDADGIGPHAVTYSTSGKKDVSLTVSSSLYGTNTITKENYISINSPAAMNNIATSELEIYPNPSTGIFNVRIPNCSNCSIKILNQEGIIIREIKNLNPDKKSDIQIDLSDKNKGVYYLQASDNNSVFINQKIVLQ